MDIYNELQKYDLKYIANLIYIDNIAVDNDTCEACPREDYDNFIEEKINEILTMDEVIDTGSDNRKYIFANPSPAWKSKFKYNKEDGYIKWTVIEENDKYIIKSKNDL